MTTNSAVEQLILELINRYRMDPTGEYDRLIGSNGQAVQPNIQQALDHFGVDLAVLEAQMAGDTAVAPLAWNDALAAAARTHSELMIQYDQQSHRVQNNNGNYVEPGLGDRISNAGYSGWNAVAENVFAYADDPFYGHAGFVIDWGNGPNGIQNPAGHRINILSASYTEIGISFIEETNSSTQVGPFVTTQNFGNRFSYEAQVLGVVINDLDGDQFYDIGEGLGGVTVTLTDGHITYVTTTADAGGYQIDVPAGTYDITFSGAGLGGSISKLVTIGSENVKVDARVDEVSGALAEPTSGNDDLMGSAEGDLIYLLAGHDQYDGQGGHDTVFGQGGRDTIIGGDGNDYIVGGNGHDLLIGDQNGSSAVASAAEYVSAPAALSITQEEAPSRLDILLLLDTLTPEAEPDFHLH